MSYCSPARGHAVSASKFSMKSVHCSTAKKNTKHYINCFLEIINARGVEYKTGQSFVFRILKHYPHKDKSCITVIVLYFFRGKIFAENSNLVKFYNAFNNRHCHKVAFQKYINFRFLNI